MTPRSIGFLSVFLHMEDDASPGRPHHQRDHSSQQRPACRKLSAFIA